MRDARAAVGALRVNAMQLPDSPAGVRLRRALEVYTGESRPAKKRQARGTGKTPKAEKAPKTEGPKPVPVLDGQEAFPDASEESS